MTDDAAMPPRRLARTRDGRLIAGVCAGLGRYTGIDPIIFRVGFALLVLASGEGLLLYVGALLLMAGPGGEPSKIERLGRRLLDGDTALALLGAGLGAITILSTAGGWRSGGGLSSAVVFACTLLIARARGVDLVQVARGLPQRVKGRPIPPGFRPRPYDSAPPGPTPPGPAPYDSTPPGPPPHDSAPPAPTPPGPAPYGPTPPDATPPESAARDSAPKDSAPGSAGVTRSSPWE